MAATGNDRDTPRERAPKMRGNGEGSVYKRVRPAKDPNKPPSVRWVAQVRVGNGWRRTMHLTEAQAKKALRQAVVAVDSGQSIPDGNETLGSMLQRWQTKVLPSQDLSARTMGNYEWACTILIDDLGKIRLRNLTADDIEHAFHQRAEHGMSRASLIKVRSVLGKALDHALRRGLVTTNVARFVDLPANARRPAEGRALTADQARELLAAAEGQVLHPLWTLMIFTGLRPGEATGLTWADIDLDNALLHVRRSLKLEDGKLVIDERLKTARSRRTLSLPHPVIDALVEQRRLQDELAERAGYSNTDGLVFTTSKGTPYSPENLRRSLAALTTKLGYGSWHPHELRHTAASLMSQAGVPIETIADQLGHDGTRMTLLVYRHQTKPSVSAAHRLTDLLASQPDPAPEVSAPGPKAMSERPATRRSKQA